MLETNLVLPKFVPFVPLRFVPLSINSTTFPTFGPFLVHKNPRLILPPSTQTSALWFLYLLLLISSSAHQLISFNFLPSGLIETSSGIQHQQSEFHPSSDHSDKMKFTTSILVFVSLLLSMFNLTSACLQYGATWDSVTNAYDGYLTDDGKLVCERHAHSTDPGTLWFDCLDDYYAWVSPDNKELGFAHKNIDFHFEPQETYALNGRDHLIWSYSGKYFGNC
jgi:hypothetical protein